MIDGHLGRALTAKLIMLIILKEQRQILADSQKRVHCGPMRVIACFVSKTHKSLMITGQKMPDPKN